MGIEPTSAGATIRCVNHFATSTKTKWHAPGGIRTPGPRIRSPMLYPAELQAQKLVGSEHRSSLLGGRFLCHAFNCTTSLYKGQAVFLHFQQSGWWESNPRSWLGRPELYHWATPAKWLEPPTPWSQTTYATKLRYAPTTTMIIANCLFIVKHLKSFSVQCLVLPLYKAWTYFPNFQMALSLKFTWFYDYHFILKPKYGILLDE